MAVASVRDFQYEKSGDINNVYSFFNVCNFTGMEATSSFALPFAGFVFTPRLNDVDDVVSRKRIVWDFGDGTSVETVTARHAYRYPGRYKVICYLYDRDGNSYYDSFSQTVDVQNYIKDEIILNSSYNSNISLICGKYTYPIIVSRYTSYQSYENGVPQLTITPYASSSISINNYFDDKIDSRHYSHLYPYSSFYLLLTSTPSITEFVEVASFETTSTPLYCCLSNNNIVDCKVTDKGSFFCGTSGTRDVYFKSDLSASPVTLMFGYQPGTIGIPYNNTSTIAVSTNINKNTDYKHLSITANGLDVEGIASAQFPINKNKFSNTNISFVIRIKDSDNYTIKDLPLLTNINLTLTDGTQIYPATFTNTTNDLGLSSGGFYKGTCRLATTQSIKNVFISAFTTINSIPLTGTSNAFNIYPTDQLIIAKKGEDIDLTQKFKEISFQSLFLDQEVLYNQFIKSIFGTLSSDQTSIGKVTYEKIKNFVDNNAVTDYANIDKLLSLFKEYDITAHQFNTYNYRYPAELTRLIDLLSINRTRLFGTQNKYSENFNSYGYLNNNIYGINLGQEITLTTPITGNIVSFEKFSGTYKKVNAYSLMQVNTSIKIINYSDSWGWGLVLPEGGYGEKISAYYLFYEYIPTIDGTIEDGVINFNDFNTTLQYTNSSYQAWSEKDGIIANMISNQLYKGLNLIK
jgi:hypothetical protein